MTDDSVPTTASEQTVTDPSTGEPAGERPGGRFRQRRYRKSDPRYQPEHDFKWRAAIRANPQSHFMYRWIVFAVGLVVVVTGLILVPFPGPGWLIVILGLLIWSSEFDRAQGLLDFVHSKVRVWNAWVMQQSWLVRGVLATLTLLFVVAVLWAAVRFSGSVAFLPEPYETWLRENLWL